MNQVWKYEIPVDDSGVSIPADSKILSVAFQGEKIFLWALVDIDKPDVKRQIITRGTGHNIALSNVEFIGTAFFKSLVFHVFEIV